MLAPRASNAFVCIRCELQLARRRLPAYARRPSRANFSTSVRRRDGADEADAPSQPQPATLRITREREPLNRIRRREGRAIRETSARLGVTALGDDAEILVLSELSSRHSEEHIEKPRKIDPLPVPDITAILDTQKEDVTPQDIRDRIESLRPQLDVPLPLEHGEPHYVSQKAFVTLIRDLSRGFTQPQLSQYYAAVKNVHREEFYKEMLASMKEETGTTKREILRSNWQPGTTAMTKRLPGMAMATGPKRAPINKSLLVDRIMRDVWKLVPLEEVEARGEVELFLKPWQITMLNAGEDDTFFKKLSETRKARIEVHQQHCVVRITADKTTAEYTADDVEKALANFHVTKLQLKPWKPYVREDMVQKDRDLSTVYTQEQLDMVSSLTRVGIQKTNSGDSLAIRGLDKQGVAEAERMLIRFLPLKDGVLRTIDTHMLESTEGSSKTLPTTYDENLIESRFRSAHVGRWSTPIANHTEAEVATGEESQLDVAEKAPEKLVTHEMQVALIIKSLREAVGSETFKKPTGLQEEDSPWEPEPVYKLSAEFGQALFPLVDKIATSAPTSDLSSTGHHLFTPSIPGLTSILSTSFIRGSLHPKSSPSFSAKKRIDSPSLLYDFIAAPTQPHLEPTHIPPTLHIQLRTSLAGADVTLHKLSLGFHQHIHDVLLPAAASDVRFTRYGRLRLNRDASVPAVTDWGAAVAANIASGGRLTAPPLTLAVPAWTIAGLDAEGSRPVTYLFAGVSFRQVVSGTYGGVAMAYSTTQAGRGGARGGALGLYFPGVETEAEKLVAKKPGVGNFVKLCLGLVDRITEASQGTQPVAKVLRPRGGEGRRERRRVMAEVEERSEEDGKEDAERDIRASALEIEDAEDGDIFDILDEAVLNAGETAQAEDQAAAPSTRDFEAEESSKP